MMKSIIILTSALVVLCIAQSDEAFGPLQIAQIEEIAKKQIETIDWKEEIRKNINIDEEVQNYINDIDLAQEFKDLTGISIGAVITIFIVIIIIPNLIIMLLIFLFCYCCKCGVFHQGGDGRGNNYNNGNQKGPSAQNSQYQPRGPSPPTNTAMTAVARPEVPTRPSTNQPSAPSSVWPWNRGQQGSQTPEGTKPSLWNRNQNSSTSPPPSPYGHQNPAYKSQW